MASRRHAPILVALILGAFAVHWGIPAFAANTQGTGLPLPRFVSLRASKANLRIGPGGQYPIEWVYLRSGVPLEVIAEQKTWRKIRDWEGAQGWVHQNMLSSKRALIVTAKMRVVRSEPREKADIIAQVEPGVVGSILECRESSPWCRVEIDGFAGWMHRSEFWGVYDDEVVK